MIQTCFLCGGPCQCQSLAMVEDNSGTVEIVGAPLNRYGRPDRRFHKHGRPRNVDSCFTVNCSLGTRDRIDAMADKLGLSRSRYVLSVVERDLAQRRKRKTDDGQED